MYKSLWCGADRGESSRPTTSLQWEQGCRSSSIKFVSGLSSISTKIPHRFVQNFGRAGGLGGGIGAGGTDAGRWISTCTSVREGAGRYGINGQGDSPNSGGTRWSGEFIIRLLLRCMASPLKSRTKVPPSPLEANNTKVMMTSENTR